MLFPNEWWSCYSADNDRPVLDSHTHFTPHSFSFSHQLGKFVVEYETILFHLTDHLAVFPKKCMCTEKIESKPEWESVTLWKCDRWRTLGVREMMTEMVCSWRERDRAMSWPESISWCWVRDIWSGQMPVRSLITPTSHYHHWSINLSRQACRPHVYDYKEKISCLTNKGETSPHD